MPTAAEAIAPPAAAVAERRSLEVLRDAAIGRFSANFLHELRNCLTGVRCYLELLEGYDLPAELTPFRTELEEALEKIVDASSQFGSVARGRGPTSYLNLELDRLLSLLSAIGVERSIQIHRDLDPGIELVDCDAAILEAGLVVLLADLLDRRPHAITFKTVLVGDHVQLDFVAVEGQPAAGNSPDLGLTGRALGAKIVRLPLPTIGYRLLLKLP